MNNYSKPEFWVTNISSRNVTLTDLAINIRSFTTINLLDKKHYAYTQEQLDKSYILGSLFNKRDKIIKRKIPPVIEREDIKILRESSITSRTRSIFTIEQKEYDELKFSDEKEKKKKTDEDYAIENAELANADDIGNFIKKV